MIRYLVVLIWPAGMAVIFGVAFLAWRRNVVMSAAAASHSASHSGPQPGRHHSRRAGGRSAFSEAVGGSARFGVMAVVGAIVVFGVMALLGLLVVYHGLAIDRPVFKWLSSHQVHAAAAVAALGFNEAYSRVYPSLHWLTDALSGLIYGGLLLLAFILAVRAVAGRSVPPWAGQPVPFVPIGLPPTEGSVP